MKRKEQIRDSNDNWLEEDQCWQKELLDWQYENQRLVALLYMLEKALPERSTKLDIHKARIDKHNEDLSFYRCELDEHCVPDCTSITELEKQNQIHKIIAHSHEQMKSEHETFSEEYFIKMHRFRELAARLMHELDAFK